MLKIAAGALVVVQLFPVALSLIALGAHFIRAGNHVLTGIVLVLLVLLGVRRRWVVRTVQAALLLGAAEWMRTLVALAASRVESGQPVLRMSLILGTVAMLTALSALVFRTARLKKWFQQHESIEQVVSTGS